MSRRKIILAAALVAALPLPLVPATAQVPTVDQDVVPVAAQSAMGCDPLDPALCLLPFPSNAFTRDDATSDTGVRIDFSPAAMPRNGTDVTTGEVGGEGKPVDPTEWNRNDGFSPGQAILTLVDGIDLHQTWGTADRPYSSAGINEQGYFDHRDQLTDIGLSLAVDAPIQVINAETGERHPVWAELDTHAGSTVEASSGTTTTGRRALIIRPAANFEEGATYVVALSNLRTADGTTIEAGPTFAGYRDGTATDARVESMEATFATLAEAGVNRDDLYLAWDFTVASERNLTERMLHIRDDAFAQLGDTDLADLTVQGDAPSFVVDSVEDRTDNYSDSRQRPQTQAIRRIEGRVTVPNYMDRLQQSESQVVANGSLLGGASPIGGSYDAPAPGSRLLYTDPTDPDALPVQNPVEPTVQVPFLCEVPVDDGAVPGVLYGHGLLGTRGQVGDIRSPRRHGFAGCALDFWGMSTPDLPTVAAILGDISNFPSLPDRAQQGFLNFLIMGRAMVHPDGLITDPAFQAADGSPLLVVDDGDGTELYYDGNSQGGIMGGAIMAVSPDASRGVLGVPGINYSTLLNRSVDWEGSYGEAYYAAYDDPIERQLGFQLLQMLWDRGEGNGYAHHMTDDPLPNTPAHDIMLQVAFSDHQVANVAAEVEARTIGAPIMEGLAPGRHWDNIPLEPRGTYPHTGSALIYWDSGNATPPNGNVPPTEGRDPHGDPRKEPAAGWQEAHFFLTGEHVDVCPIGFYTTDNHPANGEVPVCQNPDRAPGR